MSRGKLIIVSAPSGAGKSTIVSYLLDQFPNLSFSISATTRLPRGEEKHGKEYFFFSKGEFMDLIEQDALSEWEEVYPGTFYGTLESEVDRLRDEGKDVIFDIDVQGGVNLKNRFGEEALSLFIAPPDLESLEKRLRARATENEEQLKTRLDKAVSELAFSNQFDKVVVNDDLAEAKSLAEKHVRDFLG